MPLSDHQFDGYAGYCAVLVGPGAVDRCNQPPAAHKDPRRYPVCDCPPATHAQIEAWWARWADHAE